MKAFKKVCSIVLSSLMICQNGVFATTNNSIKFENKKTYFKTAAKYTAGGVLGLTGIGLIAFGLNEVIKDNNLKNILGGHNTSNWKDRYNDIPDKNRELSYEDYCKFYVSRASDGMYLHNCILDESNTNTRKLDKKFITSVMERRYAHLQQVKYVMEHFIKQTSDDKYIENVLDNRISQFEKSIEPEELKKSYKKRCEELKKYKSIKTIPTFEKHCEFEKGIVVEFELPRLREIKGKGISAQKDRDTLLELYDLIDKLLKILLYCPDKITDLKLSDKSVDRIYDIIMNDPSLSSFRGVTYVLGQKKINKKNEWITSRKYEPFMITSHEKTDRIISMLETYTKDCDNEHFYLEEFCIGISSIPWFCEGEEEFCIGKNFPKSKNLPNPYRGKHGVY